MFLCPFWPRIPTRKTSCHVLLMSCQSGIVLSVPPTSRFLTALPFASVGWPSTCRSRLGARFLGSNTRDGSCAPSSASCQEGRVASHSAEVLVAPSTWTSPSLPGFSTVESPLSSVTGILLGELLRLHRYPVLCQAPTR